MAVYTAIDFGNASGVVFNDVSVNTQMVSNNGYDVLVNSTLTMPTISARDDTLRITNFEATGFTIACNASETIFGLNAQTSSGGIIVATTPGTSLYLVCLIARTEWQILSCIGELQFS
jgi:hypothetical protein